MSSFPGLSTLPASMQSAVVNASTEVPEEAGATFSFPDARSTSLGVRGIPDEYGEAEIFKH